MTITRDVHKQREREAFLKALTALEECCFSDPWSEAMLATTLEGEHCHLFCAEEEGVLCGYLMLLCFAPEGEILNLAVLPERRREGIGNALMEACRHYCLERAVDTLFLEVRASNTPAATLYEKRGFVTVGRRKNYYRFPTEDALVMMKHLEGACEENS